MGNLSTMNLSEIFQWLSIGQKSGTLLIEKGKLVKEIYFREGKVSSASSSNPREFMGQFLLSSKKLTERQLKSCFRNAIPRIRKCWATYY